MSKLMPEASFGPTTEKPMNWRKAPDPPDPDDTELAVTPPDVTAMLGFDPLDE